VLYQRFTKYWSHGSHEDSDEHVQVLYPPNSGVRAQLPTEVPERLRELYGEAAAVEHISPNSAAFLCRRQLEIVLRQQLKTKRGMLGTLIDQYSSAQTLPPLVADLMNTIRCFGNVAGHGEQDDSGEWIDVEVGEAAYMLDALPHIYRFVYVEPAVRELMRQRAEAKNKGKNPGSLSAASQFVLAQTPPAPQETAERDEDGLPL
jgi:hypothetical protein